MLCSLFVYQEEPKKVCFNYDLFLNLEGNPPVNHLRCEKLTFNNPTKEFRRKLIKAGGVRLPFTSERPKATSSLTFTFSVRDFFAATASILLN